MIQNPLKLFNIATFLQTQLFLLPVLLLFYQHNGLSLEDFFLFQGIFALASLLFEVPSGYLGDLFPKKNVLIASFCFFILRCVLWLFFAKYGYWVLLVGEILFAAHKAFYTGVSDAYIYEYLDAHGEPQTMSKHYGFLYAFVSAGTAVSSLSAAWIYAKVSAWTLARYGQDYGFTVLLGLELVLNIVATILLCQLPKIATPQRPKKSLKEIYVNFFRIIVWTLKNGRIRSHIVLAAFLWGATALFIWSFQPMMQLLLVPVSVFGVVYFMNHACRMTFSGKTGTLMQYLNIKQLGIISFVWYLLCFIFSVIILRLQPLPLVVNLGYFLFIAIGTGWQIAYGNVHLGRLHKIVPKDIRATASSVSFMMGRLFCAFFLISLKFLIKDFSLMMSMGICGVLFLCGIFPLKKVCSIWAEEEGEKVCS